MPLKKQAFNTAKLVLNISKIILNISEIIRDINFVKTPEIFVAYKITAKSYHLLQSISYPNVSSIVLHINSADLPSPNIGVFLASDSTF